MHRPVSNCATILMLIIACAFLGACSEDDQASDGLYQAVDELYNTLAERAEAFQALARIDHSRLAAAEGEVMPPARVVIFSDPEVNTAILQQEPRAGLDLPFRVLAYAEGNSPAITYTTAGFLQRRHGLASSSALQQYQAHILDVVSQVPADTIVEFDASLVGRDQGVVVLGSVFDFNVTVNKLKDAILAESDTVWFGEIDYRAEAASLGVDLPPLKLLLWGAPTPGAKAMREFPRMGLDAFCQKTLVYEPPGEQVQVLFNEMPAFSEMHYGETALPHRVITRRMRKTLGDAIKQ